jgi:hypothetical protein
MPPCSDALAAVIRGREVTWDAMGVHPPRLLEICAEEGVTALVYRSARSLPSGCQWPAAVVEELARRAHAEAAAEIVRGEEIVATLAALADAGIQPLVLKGTSLAYTIYDEPGLRPRGDTDILVREGDVEAARVVLHARGYEPAPYCEDLFSQFQVRKSGAFGVPHVFDVHWKISTQPTFENLLTYDELMRHAEAVPALGPRARTAGPLHALLLACVHPVMHHQNVESRLWTYDLHLLASRLSPEDFDAFADMACTKEMAAVCARELRLSERMYGTVVPDSVFRRLAERPRHEPSSIYLGERRRWHHELLSILRALPGWSSRARHLRGVLFPSPQYVLGAYGLQQKPFGVLLLPALYVHRNVHGAWKILLGRK